MIRLFSLPQHHPRGGYVLALAFIILALGACGGENTTDPPAAPPPDTSAADTMTVDRVLRTDDRFSTLAAALDSTGLDSTLASDGPYTLFAPPNSAFEALPEGTLPVLLTDRLDRLRTILAHHVVEDRVPLTGISDTTALVTLAGDSLQIQPTDSTLTVGNALVLESEIDVSNGLIHVIDAVLRPPEAEEE
jgi:uncharacterized surface protein with fasciclin (FAS1) repeats